MTSTSSAYDGLEEPIVRCHLVQLDIAWEDKGANHERVRTMLESAPVSPGDLVVLPEMFDTGFSLNVETTGADPQRSIDFLTTLAGELDATVIGGITAVGPDGRGRNRAIIADHRGVAAQYDKIHPFSFGREPERFSGGGEVVVFAWGDLTVCPVICYDLRFPELFRAGLAKGAEMYVVIANWPRERAAHWRTLLAARAIENQAWVVGVNRAGNDPHLSYAGGSMVLGVGGEITTQAGEEPGVLSAEIDRGAMEAWRGRFPAWRDGKLGIFGAGVGP